MEYERRPVGIHGFERYEADTDGNIYSYTGKKMKPTKGKDGYLRLGLATGKFPGDSKTFMWHRVIAETFLERPSPECTVVNHKDGNRQNNCVENLEWCTPLHNVLHEVYVLNKDKLKEFWAYDAKSKQEFYFPNIRSAADFLQLSTRACQNGIANAAKTGEMNRKYYKGYFWSEYKLAEEEISALHRVPRNKSIIPYEVLNKEHPLYYYRKKDCAFMGGLTSLEELKSIVKIERAPLQITMTFNLPPFTRAAYGYYWTKKFYSQEEATALWSAHKKKMQEKYLNETVPKILKTRKQNCGY